MRKDLNALTKTIIAIILVLLLGGLVYQLKTTAG